MQKIFDAEVFEIACLEENTLVLSEYGYKKLNELNVGNSVITSDGSYKKICHVKISEKDCVELIGSKGFKVTCTPDHLFLSNGKLTEAKDLLNCKLDQLSVINNTHNIHSINVSQYKIERKQDNQYSRSGKIVGENFKYASSSKLTPSNVEITNELMFFYGMVVAEGSRKSISLHKNEISIGEKIGNYYNTISNNVGYSISKNGENGITVSFNNPKFYESIFFKAMGCGYGAKNKNISFLYSIKDKELIRAALYGLFLGDGCFRKKKSIKNKITYFDYSIHLKSVSKVLCEDVITLLKLHFDVSSSFVSGISPERTIENRIMKESVYYAVDVYGKSNIMKIFPDLFIDDTDYINIGNSIYSKNKNKELIIKEIVPVGKKNVYDISLEDNSTHVYAISHGVLTHNCGGGEPTKCPSFIRFITDLNNKGIKVNFTTKSIEWLENEPIANTVMNSIGAFAFSVGETLLVKHFIRILIH